MQKKFVISLLAIGASLTMTAGAQLITPAFPQLPTAVVGQANVAMTQQILTLVNQERAQVGLPTLQTNGNVSQAASVRAGELRTQFSHVRPNGSSCFTALQQAGVSYHGAGENIAFGQTSAQAVVRAWMQSPTHRANILQETFTTMGVGHKKINGVDYWVQLFTY